MINYKKKYPLHDAIIKNDISSVSKFFKDPSCLLIRDPSNLSPVDLARFLNRKEILNLLNLNKNDKIKIYFPEDEDFKYITREEFKTAFHIEYLDYLFFENYKELRKTIFYCPWKYHYGIHETEYDRLGREYEEEISHASVANVSIRWIDNTIGFGLFADADLEENSFIGTYTGKVKRISKNKEEETTYAVHYPTSILSFENKVIDSQDGGNILRFVNHSDIPNLYAQYAVIHKIIHVIFFTQKKIPKGTQLTINYGSDYWIKRKKEILKGERN